MSSSSVAVDAEALCKSFTLTLGGRFWRREKRQVSAVNGLSFSIAPGEAVAFIGPNGAGKSTTIKMLTGILHPTSGHLSVLGRVPWKERERLAYEVGAVFGQRSQLWYHLPPTDTFDLLSRIYNLDPSDYRARRTMLVERFGLGPFLQTPVRKLSLGERMRAEVAASLLHRPKVLFLDEPTIGLDVLARQSLRDLVREWNRNEGLTVFLTSHDAGDIEHLADRVLVINRGTLVLDDSVAAMRQDFLKEKILDVAFGEAPRPWTAPGVTELSRTGYTVKLRVDTRQTPIERVVAAMLDSGPVLDLSIENPPLEEVIAHIYGVASRGPA